jgi:subtilisin family serine protease
MRGSIQLLMTALVLVFTAEGAKAQLHLPAVSLPALPLQTLPQTIDPLQSQSLDRLSDLRRRVMGRLIRANRRILDADPGGEPVIRSEILALSPTETALDGARSLGFIVDREQSIEAMNIRLIVFRAPQAMSTKKALRTLREADPAGSYDYNHIYSGGTSSPGVPPTAAVMAQGPVPAKAGAPAAAGANNPGPSAVRIGLLDTGIDLTHPVFHEAVVHTWGCGDHAVPAAHGTAVASLLIGHGEAFNGVRPDAELFAADVYCGRPTGGAVDALVAALAWLVRQSVPVINISLVGPKNAMLERVIGNLITGGYIIVAAVGNDGPAAAPLYPASYPGVVGVTAVDAHRHALIEAARGPQVMFAAPGADLAAANGDHGYVAVRGTSFAAPIVAAMLASKMTAPNPAEALAAINALAKAAVDLGSPGRDLTYGFGLVGADYRIDPTPLIRR